MQKSIVFGANGYLGRHLTHFLLKNEHHVAPYGHSLESIDNHENYFQVDLTSLDEVEKVDFNVDYIFVFAGMTGTTIGFEKYKDFIYANEIALLNILNHHIKSNSKAKIIFPSTRLVYKGVENTFLKEDDKKEALTIYAQNKISCENFLEMYANYYGISYTIFRICVPYGNIFNQNYSYGTIGFFLNKALNKENITLFGRGEVKRTFSHVEDICLSIINSLEINSTKNKIYNIGSKDNLSLFEVASMIAGKYNVNVDFLNWPEDALKIESGDTIFDDSLLIADTQYKYKHSLKNWVEQL